MAYGSIWGATLTVDDDGPADFTRVQDAVDTAAQGDEVFVMPGIYAGGETRTVRFRFPDGSQYSGLVVEAPITAVVFLKDGVTLRGSGPEVTTLDGLADGTVILINEGGSETRVEGFTIQGGSGNDFRLPLLDLDGRRSAGGIMIFGGSPIISHNVIRGNSVSAYGGGMEVAFSYFTPAQIRFNRVIDNLADAGGGAGIDVTNADPIFEGNIITGNRVTGTFGAGGGIAVFDNVNPFIYFQVDSDPETVMNTIAGNEAAFGGGIWMSAAPLTWGNIVSFNRAQTGGGIYSSGGSLGFRWNDVFGNAGGNYSHEDLTGKNGNISADPLFLDSAGGDWRLTPTSPCVDAAPVGSFIIAGGKNVRLSRNDFEGNLRPLDGNRDLEAVPDIGAFEFNRGDVLGLRFAQDTETLSWRAERSAVAYNVYRGSLGELSASSFGACIGSVDPVTSGTVLVDPLLPDPATGLFYLVTQVTAAGEQTLGFDSRGLERISPPGCP